MEHVEQLHEGVVFCFYAAVILFAVLTAVWLAKVESDRREAFSAAQDEPHEDSED